MPISDRLLFAAIDLGSNSFHMLVATIKAEQIYPVDKVKQMVRLAAGLDNKKFITEEALERAYQCLNTFAQRIADIPDSRVRVVGTNTLRVAKNSTQFIEKAEQILGREIEIISGREEARMLYMGVAHSTPSEEEQRLVIDIGGGSTEVIIGKGFVPIVRESLFMGCVSMTRRFFSDGKINKKNWFKATTYAKQQITPILQKYLSIDWKTSIGASGTFRATAQILEANQLGLSGITDKNLNQLIDLCFSCENIEGLVNLKGLSQQRSAVYIGGLAIISALFESFSIESVFISNGALREGLIYEMTGLIEHQDIRTRSVARIARQFDVDYQQIKRIRHVADTIISASSGKFELGPLQQELLYHAIELHEIGLSIAHNQYQKHSAYVIRYADMPGFSKQHQLLMSVLVRQHRRKISRTLMTEINARSQARLIPLIIILRLAVIICRDRKTRHVPLTQALWNSTGIEITFSDNWLKSHPLTQADLEDETKKLKVLNHNLQLKENAF